MNKIDRKSDNNQDDVFHRLSVNKVTKTINKKDK